MNYLQSISKFWLRQKEVVKIVIVVLIVLAMLWIIRAIVGDPADDGVLDGKQGVAIVDSEGNPIKADPCGGKGEKKCSIFRDKFITEKLIHVDVIKSTIEKNTTCVITYVIEGRMYETKYEVEGPCPE